MYIGSANLFKI